MQYQLDGDESSQCKLNGYSTDPRTYLNNNTFSLPSLCTAIYFGLASLVLQRQLLQAACPLYMYICTETGKMCP